MTYTSKPPVELIEISKSFGELKVLNGISLKIEKGKITSIIGKSGEGKSVLLKHIIGLLKPDRGKIYFDGKLLSEMTRPEIKDFRKKISYMFQGNALFDSMTVFENIALPLYENNENKEKIKDLVSKRIAQMELSGSEDKYPSELSGGMQKRVALARALVNEPQIVLFDEPTTGLDPIRKNYVHKMISDYQKKFQFTAVLVSHEIPDVFEISDVIMMLDEGKIVFTGTKEEIKNTENPYVRKFVEGIAY
ncbi:MAG: ABC transporter ATP-binding protein [Desulfobacteraceae bacterium]|jgi:phospholipid/cholesterol/gamma-HCH transport system ATP-binding protein